MLATSLPPAFHSRDVQLVFEAWDEFSLWDDVPLDGEAEPEVDTAFMPWFLFNWIPDNDEMEEAEPFPEMEIARHYLITEAARRGAFERRFIEEVCSQPYSFFVVVAADPGRGLALRDVLLGREVYVHERLASETLRRGSIIFARIVSLDGDATMIGCAPISIPPNHLHELIRIREDLTRALGALDRDAMLNPAPPQVQNTDGDPLGPTELHYKLHVSPREALDALATLALEKDPEALTKDADFDDQGKLRSVTFHWQRKGNATHPSWDNTTLGLIHIDGDRLTVEVNSQERAGAIKRKLTHRLGRRAEFQRSVIQSMESLWKDVAAGRSRRDAAASRRTSDELQDIPEIRERLREMAERHWSDWLDTPLPALQGETPRQAAKSTAGRERLEALMMQFEWRNESPQPFSPDVPALRRALGLD